MVKLTAINYEWNQPVSMQLMILSRYRCVWNWIFLMFFLIPIELLTIDSIEDEDKNDSEWFPIFRTERTDLKPSRSKNIFFTNKQARVSQIIMGTMCRYSSCINSFKIQFQEWWSQQPNGSKLAVICYFLKTRFDRQNVNLDYYELIFANFL